MQAAATLSFQPLTTLPRVTPSKTLVSRLCPLSAPSRTLCPSIKATAAVANETLMVDYSSITSVFPAEACEIVGGEACQVEMYPEVKLSVVPKSTPNTASERVEREYLEYNGPKTVFLGEACDDLGGEFCVPEYLTA